MQATAKIEIKMQEQVNSAEIISICDCGTISDLNDKDQAHKGQRKKQIT